MSGISGYGNSVGVPTVGGEIVFDETYQDNPARERLLPRGHAGRAAGARPGVRRGQSRGAVRVNDRARRHRWRVGPGVRGLRRRRGRRGQASQRAGRRPLRGEAPDRGVPGPARRRPGRRHPGPGRRRPHVRHQRDRQPGRRGHGRLRLRGAPARGGHGAVRGDDEREPGADAGHRRARHLDDVLADLSPLGVSRRGGRHGHRRGAAADPRPPRRRGAGRRAGGVAARGRAPARPPAGRARRPGVPPGRLRRRRPGAPGRPGAPTCSTCSTTRRGCGQPVRPPAVPQHRRGTGRRRQPCSGSSTRPPAPTPAGAWH